jgi:hypothetical protein
MNHAKRGVLIFYKAGVLTHDRFFGSRSQSYDFWNYSYNDSRLVGYSVFQSSVKYFCLKKCAKLLVVL